MDTRIPSPAQSLLLINATTKISRDELKALDRLKLFPKESSNWGCMDKSMQGHGWIVRSKIKGKIFYKSTNKGKKALQRYVASAKEVLSYS